MRRKRDTTIAEIAETLAIAAGKPHRYLAQPRTLNSPYPPRRPPRNRCSSERVTDGRRRR